MYDLTFEADRQSQEFYDDMELEMWLEQSEKEGK